MARPRKTTDNLRSRWDALYVTPAERADVTAAAKRAGQSVSQYLLSLHRGGPRNASPETARVTLSLMAAEQQLEALSRQVQQRSTAIDVIALQAHLMAIERAFRHVAMPWSLVLDKHDGDGAPPC